MNTAWQYVIKSARNLHAQGHATFTRQQLVDEALRLGWPIEERAERHHAAVARRHGRRETGHAQKRLGAGVGVDEPPGQFWRPVQAPAHDGHLRQCARPGVVQDGQAIGRPRPYAIRGRGRQATVGVRAHAAGRHRLVPRRPPSAAREAPPDKAQEVLA